MKIQNNYTNPAFNAKGIMVGRFDPFTNSHFKMAKTASALFDEVIILPAKPVIGEVKKEFLPLETRVNLIRECVKDYPNIKVDFYDGLTGDYAREHGINFILRGARDKDDFQFEQALGDFNSSVNPDLTTIILPESQNAERLSATMVRDRIAKGLDISKMVPEAIFNFIKEHYGNK